MALGAPAGASEPRTAQLESHPPGGIMQNRALSAAAAVLLAVATPVSASADDAGSGWRMQWLVGFGLTYGGDKLAEVELEDDGDRHDEDLRGGDLITLAAGIVLYLPLPAWSIQTTIGYHFDEISADNGDIRFDRYPLEFIPFYNVGKHRLGAGLSYHLSPTLDLKELDGPKVEFDDALGWLVEYDYSFSGWENGGFVVGMRYLWIDYRVDKVDGTPGSGGDVDGNHVGVHVDFLF